jgi:hypothetical protein
LSADEVSLPVEFAMNRTARWVLISSSAFLTVTGLFALSEWYREGQMRLFAIVSLCLAFGLIGMIRSLRKRVLFLDDSIRLRQGVWGEHEHSYADIIRLRLLADQGTIYFADGTRVSLTHLDGPLALLLEIVGPRGQSDCLIEVEEL